MITVQLGITASTEVKRELRAHREHTWTCWQVNASRTVTAALLECFATELATALQMATVLMATTVLVVKTKPCHRNTPVLLDTCARREVTSHCAARLGITKMKRFKEIVICARRDSTVIILLDLSLTSTTSIARKVSLSTFEHYLKHYAYNCYSYVRSLAHRILLSERHSLRHRVSVPTGNLL